MTDLSLADILGAAVAHAAQQREDQFRLSGVLAEAPLVGLPLLESTPEGRQRAVLRARRALARSAPRPRERPPARLWVPQGFVYIRSRVVRDGEDVPIDYIYERDGHICHICQKEVSRKEATRDHLIPIAAGGPHTRENIALAHWLCNVRRGVGKRIPAQLRLLG